MLAVVAANTCCSVLFAFVQLSSIATLKNLMVNKPSTWTVMRTVVFAHVQFCCFLCDLIVQLKCYFLSCSTNVYLVAII